MLLQSFSFSSASALWTNARSTTALFRDLCYWLGPHIQHLTIAGGLHKSINSAGVPAGSCTDENQSACWCFFIQLWSILIWRYHRHLLFLLHLFIYLPWGKVTKHTWGDSMHFWRDPGHCNGSCFGSTGDITLLLISANQKERVWLANRAKATCTSGLFCRFGFTQNNKNKTIRMCFWRTTLKGIPFLLFRNARRCT